MRSLVILTLFVAAAHAEPAKTSIALLPLDADPKLEVYSQPVASEIARSLTQGGFDVVVVGTKMTVPESARLVVDGTIRMGKGDAVTFVARIRDPHEVANIETLVVNGTVKTVDQAAEELSAKVVPAVRARIAALQHKADPHPDPHPVVTQPPQPPPLKEMLAAVTIDSDVEGAEPLRSALKAAQAPWAQRFHHEAKLVELQAQVAKDKVIAEHADLSIGYDIEKWEVDTGTIPMARASVHVKIIDSTGVVWNRVVVTNSVVGDKGLSTDKLAERVAREVLYIVEPHLKRKIGSWK